MEGLKIATGAGF